MQETPKRRTTGRLLIAAGALATVGLLAWKTTAVPAASPDPQPVVVRPADNQPAISPVPAQEQKAEAPAPASPPAPEAAPVSVQAPEPQVPTITTYVVQDGDTLWDIAAKHTTDVESILALNNVSDPATIQIGTELRILPLVGTLHRVETGETLGDIAALYEVGEEEIIKLNAIADPGLIQIDQELIVPGARRVMPRPRGVVASRGESRTSETPRGMLWPLQGEITSPYGPRWGRLHAGLDIAGDTGTPIRAALAGRVVSAGWDGSYGLAVLIEHENGLRTRYAHASVLRVAAGDWVEAGTMVADVGSTGFSTGPHLHFEVIDGGVRQDPMRYLP